MPDIMKIGGVIGKSEAAALAASAGTPLSSHIFTEASAPCVWQQRQQRIAPARFIVGISAGELLEQPVEVIRGKDHRPEGPALA